MFQIIQVFKPAGFFFCLSQVIYVQDFDFQAIVFKPLGHFKTIWKPKALHLQHNVDGIWPSSESEHIHSFFIKKILPGHFKNTHSKLIKSVYNSGIIWVCSVHPNVHISSNSLITMKNDSKSSYLYVFYFTIIQSVQKISEFLRKQVTHPF